ncbi:MAG: hypothetical protein AB7O62_07090 [Pirellulales bacterium]
MDEWSTGNYAARMIGRRRAMPAATARRLCPQVVLLPCLMDFYPSL